MKKIILVSLLFILTGVMAYANNNDQTIPGDPKKEKENKPGFELTKDYFNLFAIFEWTAIQPDSVEAQGPVIIQPRKKPLPKPTN